MYVRIRHIMFERNHKQNSRKACKERALLLLALFYLNQYCRLMITNDTKSASLNYITMLQLPVKCFREMLQSSVLRSFCLPVGIDDCGHRRNDCTEEEKCFDVFCVCTFTEVDNSPRLTHDRGGGLSEGYIPTPFQIPTHPTP